MNTDISMNTATSFSVKVSRGEEKRRFNFSGKSFQELKAVIAELYSLPVDDFILQYEDDEKDRVTLSSDAEFMEAIKLYKYVLRFFVVNKNPTAATTHQQVPYPFPPHYHRGGRHHGPHGPHDMFPMHMPPPPPALTPEGEVAPVSPPHHHHHHHHRGGRHHGPHGPLGGYSPYGFGPYGHHGHKRCKEEKERCREEKERIKEERKMMKCEKKRFKKQRKCESSSSSSSSSSEDNAAQKVQKHEMKQLMRETKQQIKKNWQATKAANPAQWPENRKLMIAEIKAAKRMIAESLNTPAGLVPVEQNVTPAPSPSPVTEMQA